MKTFDPSLSIEMRYNKGSESWPEMQNIENIKSGKNTAKHSLEFMNDFNVKEPPNYQSNL